MEENNEMKRILIAPELRHGKFATATMISHTNDMFFIDSISYLPGMPQPELVSRVIVSPEHAKALLASLSENVSRYKSTFGPIRESKNKIVLPLHPNTKDKS